jgi:hypothetical protein
MMFMNPYIIAYLDRISGKDERHFGQLRPLCTVNPNSLSVEMIATQDLMEEFPNKGCISWVGIPLTALPGSLWEIRISEQPFEADNPMHDRYKVAQNPLVPYEVVDARDLRTVECAEQFFATTGLQLRFKPNDRVLLRIGERLFIGPVQLVPNQTGLLTVEVVRNGQPLPPFGVHTIPLNRLIQVDCDGHHRTIISAGASLGNPKCQVDWSPDELVLKRVLRQAKEVDHPQLPILTNKILDTVAKLLTELGSPLETYRFERAVRILSTASAVERLLPKIIGDILELPEVKAKLEVERETARQQAVEGVHSQLQEVTAQVRALEVHKIALQAEIENVNHAVQESEKDYQSRLATLEQDFRNRIRALADTPGDFLAELAVLRSVIGSPSGKAQDTPSTHARVAEPFVAPSEWKNSGRRIDSLQELKKSAQTHRGNVSADTMRQVIGTLGAGLVPIVTGPSALRCLTSVGKCLVGGRATVVPISSNTTDTVDLLGTIQNYRFIPAGGELANLLLEARDSKDLYLVILDGINRAATESYLLPLINLYWAEHVNESRALSLFSPTALLKNDSYKSFSRLIWPRNVLLAGTAVRGPSVLPLTSDILQACTIIYSQLCDDDASSATKSGDLTSIAFERWPNLFEATKEVSQGVQSLVSELKLDSDVDSDRLHKLCCSIGKWSGGNSSLVVTDILRMTLLPVLFAASRSDGLPAILGKFGVKPDELARLQQNLAPLLSWK